MFSHLVTGTVFAYGQTNSGKTHTMRGSTAEPGVIPLAVRDLFHIIQEVDTCHHKSTSIAVLVTVKFGGDGCHLLAYKIMCMFSRLSFFFL